jgi:hypothetical protein
MSRQPFTVALDELLGQTLHRAQRGNNSSAAGLTNVPLIECERPCEDCPQAGRRANAFGVWQASLAELTFTLAPGASPKPDLHAATADTPVPSSTAA